MGNEGKMSKSERIRQLYRQGKSIGEIARELGIRYQFAYNVLVNSGLHKPNSSKQPTGKQPGKADPQTYADFIRGIEIVGVFMRSVAAELNGSPEGSLGYEIRMEPLDPVKIDGGFVAGLFFVISFFAGPDDEKGKPFGSVEAEWFAHYRSEVFPEEEIYDIFARRNLPVNLWPYFRVQVDQLTAQMGLPRLVLPAFKTVR